MVDAPPTPTAMGSSEAAVVVVVIKTGRKRT